MSDRLADDHGNLALGPGLVVVELIRAFAEKLQPGWKRACEEAGARLPIIFTAHSVPTRTIEEGDPYEQQARETAEMVAMEVPSLGMDDWTFAFQSQG
ncbi:MAG: ferrochelatase, partial [Mycobacteriaceae bacterium]